MHAAEYQPRLGRWGHTWRVLLTIAISGLAWGELSAWQVQNDLPWFYLDLGLGLAALALVTQRRRWPFAVALVLNAAGFISASVAGPATLALVSLSTRRRLREIIPVGIVALGASLFLESVNPLSTEQWQLTTGFIVGIVAVTIGWGMYIGSRRELLATLRGRAEAAENEQAARVTQARMAERSRIAREMHDVLAHRISLITMNAGALTFRDDLSPEQMRDTAKVIQDSSHQAMVELREVLGVLREDPGDADPERPQPTATDIPVLIDEARATGMNVDSLVSLADGVPEQLGRATYRIVQEGLTNARKHAPDTRVSVRANGDPASGITVTVSNPLRVGSAPATPDSGLGLLGLAERAALAGGRLSHRVTPDRVFVVSAWLPWRT